MFTTEEGNVIRKYSAKILRRSTFKVLEKVAEVSTP